MLGWNSAACTYTQTLETVRDLHCWPHNEASSASAIGVLTLVIFCPPKAVQGLARHPAASLHPSAEQLLEALLHAQLQQVCLALSYRTPLQLEEVYAEIRRVLKPGGLFASYEWVATKEFDPNNPEHVRIIDEINFGNGLPVGSCSSPTSQLPQRAHACRGTASIRSWRGLQPSLALLSRLESAARLSARFLAQEMRTYKEAEEAGRKAGMQLVESRDIATASSVAGPW